jgi:hypothetical protein
MAGQDMAGQGKAWQGMAWHGRAGHGMAGQGRAGQGCEETHAPPQLGLQEEEEEVSVQEKLRGQEPPVQVNKEAGGAAAADLPVHTESLLCELVCN